ncbi:MAG: HNH endonuclease [Planctomycetes bacterium]|nr:HNH endonuclease [Planctomycetota bacterium]
MPNRIPDHRPARPARPARESSSSRGYGWQWRKASKLFLLAHPLCADCESNGQVVAAQVVDHIIPHRGDQVLFWDEGNWQPLCKTCHNRKSASGL